MVVTEGFKLFMLFQILDWALGHNESALFRRAQLKALVSIHGKEVNQIGGNLVIFFLRDGNLVIYFVSMRRFLVYQILQVLSENFILSFL